MGKRSSTKAPPKKQRPKLDLTFNCPFCNSSKSVTCLLDREAEKGTAKCSVCLEKFTGRITPLTDPVDLYHDWLDQVSCFYMLDPMPRGGGAYTPHACNCLVPSRFHMK